LWFLRKSGFYISATETKTEIDKIKNLLDRITMISSSLMLKKGSEKFEYFFQGRRDVSKSKDKKFELTFKESEPYGLDEQRIEIEKILKFFMIYLSINLCPWNSYMQQRKQDGGKPRDMFGLARTHAITQTVAAVAEYL